VKLIHYGKCIQVRWRGWMAVQITTYSHMVKIHKLNTQFQTATDIHSLTDLCNITIPVLNMAWKKSYKSINKSTNDSKASVSEGRAVIVLHDALHTLHIRLCNVLHRQDTAIGVHCELWLHRICEVGPIVWKRKVLFTKINIFSRLVFLYFVLINGLEKNGKKFY